MKQTSNELGSKSTPITNAARITLGCLAIATLSLWGCATEQEPPPALEYPAALVMEAQKNQVPAGNSSVAFRGGNGEFSCCLSLPYDVRNKAEIEKARKEGKKP